MLRYSNGSKGLEMFSKFGMFANRTFAPAKFEVLVVAAAPTLFELIDFWLMKRYSQRRRLLNHWTAWPF